MWYNKVNVKKLSDRIFAKAIDLFITRSFAPTKLASQKLVPQGLHIAQIQ